MPDETKPQLFVIGALHVDEIATAIEPFVLGESNPVRWTRRVGGVAANAARAAAFAAPQAGVNLLANCADDGDGASLVAAMQKTGVDVLAANLGHTGSGRYSAVVQPDGEVLVGLADVLQAEEISVPVIFDHLSRSACHTVLFDSNLSAATIDEFTRLQENHRQSSHNSEQLNYSCNTVMAVSVSPSKALRLVNSLPFLDVLFCNRAEAIALVDAIGSDTDASTQSMLAALCAQGCSHIVMTDGAKGVHIQSKTKHTHIPVKPVPLSASMNGPGDALAGATAALIAAATITHSKLADAVLQNGIPAAQSVVTGDVSAPDIHPNT